MAKYRSLVCPMDTAFFCATKAATAETEKITLFVKDEEGS